MAKVNFRKAASYAAMKNQGAEDVSVAQASEIIDDFLDYLTYNHKISEIIARLEERY